MNLPTIPHDKSLHLIYGVVIYMLFHFISPVVGLLAVLLVAIGKEVHDYYSLNHQVEFKDFLYTMIGGLLGFISGL
jgi:hypothetical protein